MPKALERKLIKEAKKRGWWSKKGLTERGGRYVYGTLAKLKKKGVI